MSTLTPSTGQTLIPDQHTYLRQNATGNKVDGPQKLP